MSYLIIFLTGLLIGFVAGVLVYRKNGEKLKATEAKGKHLIDALKGR
jgi:F0F1-type ATP synthase assembly protein I